MDSAYAADIAKFKGLGLNFNAKLIGVQEVPTARGENICQEVIGRLKQNVLSSGVHKQKIVINISLEGLRMYDMKSNVMVHHHTVDTISFIARDTLDPRAFSYIHTSGDNVYHLFAIKTEAAADALVLSLRDLFQAVYMQRKAEAESKQSTDPTPTSVATTSAAAAPATTATAAAASAPAAQPPQQLQLANVNSQWTMFPVSPTPVSPQPGSISDLPTPERNAFTDLVDLMSADKPPTQVASQQSNVNDLMNFGAKAWDSVFTPAAMSAPVRLPPPNYSTVQSIPQFNDPFAPRPPIVDPFGAQPYMIDPFGPVAQKPATGPGPQSVYGLQQPFAPSNQPYSLQQPQFGYSQPQFGFPRPTQPAAQASSNFNPFKTDVQQTTFGTGLHTSNSASSLNATANVNWNNQPAAAAPSAKPLHDPFASLIASPPVINKPSPIGPAVKPLAPPPSASANQHSALNNGTGQPTPAAASLVDLFG